MNMHEQLRKNLEWLIGRWKTNPTALSKAIGSKPNGKPIMTQPTIARILKGDHQSPRNSTLQPLAEYFGVSVSDLWEKDLSAEGNSVNVVMESRANYGAALRKSKYEKRTLETLAELEMHGDAVVSQWLTFGENLLMSRPREGKKSPA